MKNHNINTLIEGFAAFAEPSAFNRFFKHEDLLLYLTGLPGEFQVSTVGHSVEQRSLHLVKWGKGPVKVFLWSQMHGDEATGTMALMDLFNFLQKDINSAVVEQLQKVCTLYILPMVNPDGAARFTRRNARQIDINRDYLETVSPEARILKDLQRTIQPDFGFNLHDQNTLWSVSGSAKPATLSFLAPAFDKPLSLNSNRKNAMLVIADIFETLSPLLPGQIGLFDDEYEPRAFGDNFQEAGMATILIEAGGLLHDDEKQELRKYYFAAIFSGLISIATKSYAAQEIDNYHNIPKNNKQIFHLLIRDIQVRGIQVDLGLNYEEQPYPDGSSTFKRYYIEDLGDLHTLSAYQVYQDPRLTIKGEVLFNEPADFDLLSGTAILLSFKNGLLESKL